MSTATLSAGTITPPGPGPRPAGRRASARRHPRRATCRGPRTTLRVLPDGSVRIPPAALREAARQADRSGAMTRPVLTIALAPAAPAPVAQPPRVARTSPLRPVPSRPDAADAPATAAIARPAALAGSPGATTPLRPVRLAVLPEAPRARVHPGSPSLRLTRRGRLLLTLLATTVLVTGLLAGATALPDGLSMRAPSVHLPSIHLPSVLGAGSPAVGTDRVTVRPGETLWAIATRTAPGADPRDTIASIESINNLPSSAVQAGTVLRVPRAG